MDTTTLYDFETAIEAAFKAFLEDQELDVLVPPFSEDAVRPRVELQMTLGGAKSENVVSGSRRFASYSGSLAVEVVTESGTEGNLSHRAYRAMVRKMMDDARTTLTANDATRGEYLPFHVLQDVRPEGCAPSYETEQGYEISRMTYRIEFGIDRGAWAELSD